MDKKKEISGQINLGNWERKKGPDKILLNFTKK